ncbi:hypothetical protein BDZ45DRAFT_679223 [Acephala macrosclerotiorum]|nr:hypothetical protein BDZ45DRAFT_679223 [Acephala macrosclerotiorum]
MCGKGVDQTMRTAQRWAVLAPELNERHFMGDEGNMGFDLEKSFFTNLITFDVWGALARPVLPAVEAKQVEKEEHHVSSRSLGVFDILSNELVDLVVESVSDLGESDLVALGLTCQGFWELVVHRVQKNYVKKAAPWARKKIALQGSWSTSLPETFNEGNLAAKIVDDNKYRVNKHVSRCLFCFMEAEGEAPKTTKTRETGLMNAMDEHLHQSKIQRGKWKEMWEKLKCPDLFPSGREWVLRNLTTNELVGPTSHQNQTDFWSSRKEIGLGIVLIS